MDCPSRGGCWSASSRASRAGSSSCPTAGTDHIRATIQTTSTPCCWCATARKRRHERSPVTSWSFARLEAGRVVADPNHVYLAAGFEPGKIYEVIYTTTGAPMIGLGLLAARDVVSFLRYSRSADNPCAGDIQHAYAFGASQSGRFLRQLLYLGFNEDETAQIVFDGMLVHIAGGKRGGDFNMRFGQPSASLAERPVPIQRDGCHRSGQRSARRSPRTPRRAPSGAENLLHQHLVRILARRRLADPHRCERHA